MSASPPFSSASASSGDVIADKRYAYGQSFEAEDDLSAAADLFAQAAEAAPHWAAAHFALGSALQRGGDPERAAQAFAAARACDPADILGAGLSLDRLRGVTPPSMSPAYVAALFDGYAGRFDAHLVDALRYCGPAILADVLRRDAGTAPDSLLDLGCGTGLMGRALSPCPTILDGIDLSEAMLREAGRLDLYRHLWCGDCATMMRGLPTASYAAVVAADVLVYLGALEPLFEAVAHVLRPGGLFAATVQSGPTAGYSLGEDLRFRHSEAYLRATLASADLRPGRIEPCATRIEKGVAVAGLVFTAHRP